MRKLFPGVPNLLKAHIDYLLMTGLLMIFFLLFAHFPQDLAQHHPWYSPVFIC